MNLRKKLFVAFLVMGGVLTSTESRAACLSSAVTAGTSARASQYNNLRQDFYTGKFYDSACAGSKYVQAAHDGTNGILQSSDGKLRLISAALSQVDIEVGGTDKLTIGDAGITASVYIATSSNIGASGSLEIDGTSKLDGILTVGGAATLSSTLTASGAIGTTSTGHFGGAFHAVGAMTAASTLGVTGLITAAAGIKASATSDTLDNYDKNATCTPTYGGVGTTGSCTYSVQVCNYNRVGNLVNLSAIVTWTSCGTPPVGQPYIDIGTAPPFANISNYRAMCSIGITTGYTLTAGNIMTAYGQSNSTRIYLIESTTGGGGAGAPIDTAGNITVGCSYQTD